MCLYMNQLYGGIVMVLEVIATNITDAKQAETYGANRIELSPGMSELGITPSYGLIESVAELIETPFNVIIRPHTQSFVYNNDDVKIMKKDIQTVKESGGNGIILGPLTEDRVVDQEDLKQLLDITGDLDVTFHKAFDYVRSQEEALETLSKYPQVKRVATSGGMQRASLVPKRIKKLIELSHTSHLEIMLAGGLKEDNFKTFYQNVKPKEVHFGSGIREDESHNNPIDENKVDKIKQIIQGKI